MCICQSLGECVEVSPTREKFVSFLKKLDHNSKLWAEIFVCNSCSQFWIVEKGAEMDRRANKAFKINNADNWMSHDTSPALAQWLIKKHGGLSEKQCISSGCEKKALNGMVFCVEHGHTEYQWSQNT